MNKENKTILLNQLRIMSAMQRLEYFVHKQEIEDDLSEGIKDTQKILDNDIDNKISIQQENTNLKQALNEIRNILSKYKEHCEYVIFSEMTQKYLQIIDKVLGDEK